jgi:histidine triad (HIT) family protein
LKSAGVAELADALASGASDRKIIGVRLPSPAQTLRHIASKHHFMEECIFCKIVAGTIPSRKIWENDEFFVFLDMIPVEPGHLLIIPKQHFENIFHMPDGLYNGIFKVAKVLSAPLQKAMNSARIGIVIEGFGVPHGHVHLVPINKAHDLDSSKAKPVPTDELAAIEAKIKKEVEKADIK